MASPNKPNAESHVTIEYIGAVQGPAAVYKLTHVRTGYFYIGSSGNMEQRRWDHLKRLNNGTHPNLKFQQIFKVGDHLHFDIEHVIGREEAYNRELAAFKYYRGNPLLLNVLVDSVRGFAPGHVVPDEVKQKLALKRGPDHHMYGRPHSEEHRANLSASMKGRTFSPESIEKMRQTKLGKQLPAGSGAVSKISINGVVYERIADAVKALGLTDTAIRGRLDSPLPRWKDWIRLQPKRTER